MEGGALEGGGTPCLHVLHLAGAEEAAATRRKLTSGRPSSFGWHVWRAALWLQPVMQNTPG